MTGPEHYQRAEEYMEKARGSLNAEYDGYVARAQVHATLALAAAAAMSGHSESGMSLPDFHAWDRAAGVPREG